MELTKEQIQRVEKYLDAKDVNYIDIRVEILDHILSELENCTFEKSSFEEIFNTTIKKWNSLLEDSSSAYIGHAYVKPKIVIDKMKKIGKSHFPKVSLSFFVMLILINTRPDISTPYTSSVNMVAQFFVYLMVVFIGIGYILIRKSKQKTSYRFLYKTQVLPCVLFPFILFGDFINKEGNLDLIQMVMLLLLGFVLKLGIQLYKSHFLAIKKYASS